MRIKSANMYKQNCVYANEQAAQALLEPWNHGSTPCLQVNAIVAFGPHCQSTIPTSRPLEPPHGGVNTC